MEKILESRRRFIFGSAIGAAGALSGFVFSNPLLAELIKFDDKKNVLGFTPSIWVEITKENKIIVTNSRAEIGQGSRTIVAMIIAEELDARWEDMEVVQAIGDSKYGDQSTGGSTTVRVLWDPLRKAGAQARAMLITAAAQIWGVPESECYTQDSYVHHKNSNKALSYGELIEKAMQLPIPPASSIKTKQTSEFKILGKKSFGNFDEPDIVTGKAIYSADFKYPGMKYATILRCPYVGGSLVSYDDSDAKKIKGVLDVFNITEGLVVVAENSWAALQGRNALKATWRPGPRGNFSSDDISKAMLDKVGPLPNLPQNTTKFIETIYEVPFLAHATMEPMAAFAHFKDGRCEVYAGTQNPQAARGSVANTLGIPQDKVTINVLLSGGGFGRRHNNDYIVMAAYISKISGQPVSFFYTKEEDIKNDDYRPASIHVIKAGIDQNGNPTGWIHKVVSQGWVSASNPFYNIPNVTNLRDSVDFGVRTGAWRAVDYTQVNFANESMIDELAYLAGKDPYEYRYNLASDGKVKNVLKKVAEKAKWGTPLPKGWGRGIAVFVGYGAYIAHVIEVSVDENGKIRVHKIYAVVDPGLGLNPEGIKNQLIGGAVDGLSTALVSEITVKNGQIEQSGFHNFRWLNIDEAPEFDIEILQTSSNPSGMGEVGFPSITPALCNAIYDATGIRIRKLPISRTKITEIKEKKTLSNNYDYQVYPNPFSSSFTIEFKTNDNVSQIVNIEIYDLSGKLVDKKRLILENNLATGRFDLSSQARGTYFAQIKVGDFGFNVLLVKQ